jgi:histidinol-phosphate phosphatase family protein
VSGRFVFLDRDGTLVRDPGYVHRLEDYALLPGVREGLARLAVAGFRFAIVTNQSGIGRGYFREADYAAFEARLVDELAGGGIVIERSYFCPHRPDAACVCRKPAPGLLFAARDELGADLAASWVVGDSLRDLDLARQAGCRGAVLVGEASAGSGSDAPRGAPFVLRARDLPAAAEAILAQG